MRQSRSWVIDGGTIAVGEDGLSLRSIGLGALSEVVVQRAAGDASLQRGDKGVSLVVREGGRRASGRARLSLADPRLQSGNLTPALLAQGAGAQDEVGRATEISVEMGGPIEPGKAWVWSTASAAREHETTASSLATKLSGQWARAGRSAALWAWAGKNDPRRGASPYRRPESTTRQSSVGVVQPIQLSHEWTVSDRLAFDGRVTYSNGGYVLDFQQPHLAAVQGAYDRYSLVNSRSAVRTELRRTATDLRLAGSGFLPGLLGGDHAMAFGVQFQDRRQRRSDAAGGGAVAVFDSRSGEPAAYQARILRDGQTAHRAWQWSAYFQDSYRRGSLTVNAGIRFDRQDDRALAADIPANSILPDLLPAVRFRGADSGVVYDDLSPRFSAVWDVTPGREELPATARRTTVLKIAAARYRAVGNDTSEPLQPTGQTRLVYWWNDLDGDAFVQRNELDASRGFAATPTSNYDASAPGSVRTLATVDPRLRNVVTDELTLGLERQLARRVILRASYTARRMRRLQGIYPAMPDGSPVESTTFRPVRWAPASCPAGAECPAVVYYERELPLPAGSSLRNDGQYVRSQGVDVALHRRLSGGWMLDLALAWNRTVRRYPRATRDYADPTNVAMRDGTSYPQREARWEGRAAAAAQAVWGVSISAFLNARQGFPYDRVLSTPQRGALGSASVSVKPFGSERYPGVFNLDLRADRRFHVVRLTLVPAVSVTNALNSNAVLSRNRVQNSGTANFVTAIAAPRSTRIELAMAW